MIAKIRQIFRLIIGIVLYPILNIIPRDSSKVVFGAWAGMQFGDNPKYLLLELLRQTRNLKCYWIGHESIRSKVLEIDGVQFVTKGSLWAMWHLLTAKFYVCNVDWRWDLGDIPIYGRVIIINLWHGIPYKRIGMRQIGGTLKNSVDTRSLCSRIKHEMVNGYKRIREWMYSDNSWVSVSSHKMGEILCSAFPQRYSTERMLFLGSPRNDFLVQNKNNVLLQKQLKMKYARLLGLPVDKKWFLYLPTWRWDSEKCMFSFATSLFKTRYEDILLAQDAVLIEKQHHIVLKRLNLVNKTKGPIYVLDIDQATKIDLQELLLVSERLISDYSSCFFDFAILERPCVHFVYDYDEYTTGRPGVEYTLHEIAAGAIAKNEDELLVALNMNDVTLLSKRGNKWKDPILDESGHSSKEILKILEK